MKKRWILLALVLIIAITAFLLPKKSENVFLNWYNKGDCKSLKGNVLFAVLFTDQPDLIWTEKEKEVFLKGQTDEADLLVKEAEKYGVSLNINFISLSCATSLELDLFDNSLWIKEALASSGFPENTVETLKAHYGMDEVVIIFALKGAGRPFALPADTEKGFECAFVYASGVGFRHEILHLFGAKDFYYPSEIHNLAKEKFPDSVMLLSKNRTVDSFTAYLIGWSETPDSIAQSFLDSTAHISQKDMNKALEEETLTGFGQKILHNGIYEGELLNGVSHGEGTLWFNNGDVYSGSFTKGELDGFGTYVWENGDTYQGEFIKGVRTGQGTRKFINGDVYSGSFFDGKMHGKGTLSLADGSVYTGDFIDGEFFGKGSITYPDGSSYNGDFEKNKYDGFGTWTFPDGSVFSGEFELNKAKKGIFTKKDGTVYNGSFFDFYGPDNFRGYGTVTYPDGTTDNF